MTRVLVPPLACPVRGCGRPLSRDTRAFACPSGHSHDLSRHGYINLLQPQDRKSASPGDSHDAVQARARLVAAGVGRTLVDALAERVCAWAPTLERPVIAELGSGSGDLLGAIAERRTMVGLGLDLSAAAADLAARRFPSLIWIVANADRRLPLLDGSVDLVISVHARRNPPECARILAPGGALLVAVPAHDDLVELRQALHGAALSRDRAEGVVAEHAPWFAVDAQWSVRDCRRLDAAAIADLLLTTYRGQRASAISRTGMLGPLDVTLASDVTIFVKRGG